MAKIPQQYTDQPEMVNAVTEARRIQMETEDTSFAIEWLMEHYPMSLNSATRVLEDETFLYVALYPEGHPGLEALRAEQRAKSRRSYNMKKLRPQIIDRDDSRCQNCNKRVKGGDATLDHKDPEGPETLENMHLLCRACNTLKGKRSWETFQNDTEEWRTRVEIQQNERPNFTCERTGLSVRGRSWQEAGCQSPGICMRYKKCDNGREARMNACPCHPYGCFPDCTGCEMCEHDEFSPPVRMVCPTGDHGFSKCLSEATCKSARACAAETWTAAERREN